MNETAAIDTAPNRPARVWVGADRLVFSGLLPPVLDWHRHGFHCVLLSAERPFEVDDGRGPQRCQALLVPGGQNHRLRFDGQPMLTMYIPPHDDDFAALRVRGGVATAAWHHDWSDAIDRWHTALDARPLNAIIRRAWARPAGFDHRVRRLAHRFATADGLKRAPAALAADFGLSGSRLAHLVKDHTGSSVGEVQRAYKFTHAARSMLAASNFTRAAHAAQFADSAHFSRSFRAAYGIAPSRILAVATEWANHDGL